MRIAVALFLVCVALAIEKGYAESWARAFGGVSHDTVFSAQQTSDGGYVLTGSTGLFPATNIKVMKLDSAGNLEWQKTYGGNSVEFGISIEETADGGYIIGGQTFSFGAGSHDAWILKLDLTGNIQWQKTYGGDFQDSAESIHQTLDGGYIVAGSSHSFGAGISDMWVLKLNSAGDIEWQRTYGGIDGDFARSIKQTSDGGYIVGGETFTFGSGLTDYWILKLDSTGNIQWQNSYGGTSEDYFGSIQQTSDSGYIVCGSFDFHLFVMKLDSAGNIQWQKTYSGGIEDHASSIQQTVDGGYAVAGWVYPSGSESSDIWALKLDSTGDIEWQKTYGGNDDDFGSIQQTSDAGYFIYGSTNSFGAGYSDFWALKVEPNGEMDPSCSLINQTSATPANASSTRTASAVSPMNTSTIPLSSAVTPAETTALVFEQCPNPTCQFCDEFDDGALNLKWTYLKDISFWSEDGANLIGNSISKKSTAIADPIFAGCTNCSVEASMSTAGGAFNQIWLLFHVQDSKTDYVELLGKEEGNRWVLKHRIGKKVVAKGKFQADIDPNVFYSVRITFDGTNYLASIDGVPIITLSPGGAVTGGTVGFKLKKTVATFQKIQVTP